MDSILPPRPGSRQGTVQGRHVDKLDVLPDELLKKQDEAYLAKHQLDVLFGEILQGLVKEMPTDPVQFIIDSVAYGVDQAVQDKESGMPLHRKLRLLDLFRIIDKQGTGRISFRAMQQYANRYGGQTLGAEELGSIFSDFKPGSDNLITQDEFVKFFSRVSKTITNAQFEAMVKEMMN
ncbi:hypothetical protein PLESTB_001489900 [Pleodorina starrii]|uniref:EF-hand domain-containing protein n=1 Tax=Pleodorina starrii TaxID=330485 RepID=A0A9W6F898_9CHLO|nr:hypothetical protein PLESTM_001453800 [Pleodorina starrii]GLC59460.1 hypothetical protein PLESTB_001489900 [Pleodorina starrii]GLC66339.1 hypothetical protein PLESTF_000413200 [Pleodorina starrii]